MGSSLTVQSKSSHSAIHPPDASLEALASELYAELKRLARAKMRRERGDHTLQPTALINELYLRLLRNPDFVWKDRSHFLLSASQAMRHMLVDHARERRAAKRGGLLVRLDLSDAAGIIGSDSALVLDVDEALVDLEMSDPRMARVVELKFFAGMTFAEIGRALGVDERTAKRDWTLAREWLREKLRSNLPNDTKPDERGGMGAH